MAKKIKQLTPLNDSMLKTSDRLVLKEVLYGKYRMKYLQTERISINIGVSFKTIYNSLIRLHLNGFIHYAKPKGKRYYIVIVLNKTFKRYGINSDQIKENRITSDETLRLIAAVQADEMAQPIPDIQEMFNAIIDGN